jgi:23S rRNA (uracil1939-C5)-methyltransferase
VAETIKIRELGHAGDGIGEVNGQRVFVPYTLAGETADIDREGARGRLIAVVEPSPARVSPPCRHFGTCGGCALQHMERNAYLAWKREVVRRSFLLHHIDAPVEPVAMVPPGARRRAIFSAVNAGGRILLGFHRRASQDVIAIGECPVLSPEIVSRLPLLREIAARAIRPRKQGRIVVLVANGLDITVSGGGRLGRDALEALGQFGREQAIARLTVDGAEVFVNRRPDLPAGTGAAVLPVAGGFVQATAAAEDIMARMVLDHVGDASPVADLFCGAGTFTLRLAQRTPVTAIEGDDALLAALEQAARKPGLKTVTRVRRDLFANPLAQPELDRFRAIVFDPPAAGAKAQAEAIALSKVPKVVAVSCNPATLARDSRILLDGGYRLDRVLPVDQFLWSAEIEAVATFSR